MAYITLEILNRSLQYKYNTINTITFISGIESPYEIKKKEEVVSNVYVRAKFGTFGTKIFT